MDQGKGGKKELGAWPRDAEDGRVPPSYEVLVLFSLLTGTPIACFYRRVKEKGQVGELSSLAILSPEGSDGTSVRWPVTFGLRSIAFGPSLWPLELRDAHMCIVCI